MKTLLICPDTLLYFFFNLANTLRYKMGSYKGLSDYIFVFLNPIT